VAIARALLRDAPVVLLDEPTSNLDAEAEDIVVEALRPLIAGRTVIMATHRLALLGLADRIINLDGAHENHAGASPEDDMLRTRQDDPVLLARRAGA